MISFLHKVTASNNEDFSDHERIMIAVLNFFTLMSIITLTIFSIILFFKNDYSKSIVDFITAALLIITLFYFGITKKIDHYRLLIIFYASVFFLYLVSSGGRENTGLYWCYIYPVLSFYLLGYKKATYANLILLSAYSLILFLPDSPFLFTQYDLIVKFRFLISNLFVIIFAFMLEYARFNAYQKKEKLIDELQTALDEVKELSGLLPICANCKSIRDDKGFWIQVEDYLSQHSDIQFSHSLCQNCIDELYGKNFLLNNKKS